jgi:valyl-tRNA synthetase
MNPGKLYYFKYRILGSDEFIPVATTRPETILGDTAVAVHPEDERFKHLVGKLAIVPILGREIPVIADTYVDRAFGTGALKITPAHDPNDYEIGERHNLAFINVLNKDATINENGGQYAGMDRMDCRQKLWADMEAADLVIKVQPYQMKVPRSQRGGELIEPMISTQWFVDVSAMAEAPWMRSGMAGSRSSPSGLRRCITTGWKISRIGASAASCGGGTASRCGTVKTAMR